jgi:hypothetical protein
MKDEALKLALEALERGVATCFDRYSHEQVLCRPEHFINQAITAIKQALAAPVQPVKPSLWEQYHAAQPAPVQERTDYAVHLNHCNIGECEGVCKYLDDDCPALKHADMKAKWDRPTPPAAQRQWVGLTDDERTEIRREHYARTLPLMDAVEAKLRSKNT